MKQKNKIAKLQSREADYNAMMKSTRHESKVQSRIDSGGYKKPGSCNK